MNEENYIEKVKSVLTYLKNKNGYFTKVSFH